MNEPATDSDLADSPTGNAPQFGLLEMFYAISVYAVGLLLSPWTLLWTSLVIAFWWLLIHRKISLRGWIVCVAITTTLFLMLCPASQTKMRVTPRRPPHLRSARGLMLSMLNYESRYMRFPPAYLLDADGNPGLSWRVILLPFIEEEALFAKFNLDEPWDSPNNIELVKQMPEIFATYSSTPTPGHTAFKLLVDKGTAFEPGRAMGSGDIGDGSSNTVGLVEDVSNLVPWTKPEDLTVEEAVAVLANKKLSEVAHARILKYGPYRGLKTGGSGIGVLDGSTHVVGAGVDPDVIRRLCLRDDGRVVKLDELYDRSAYQAARRRLDRQYYCARGVYFLLLIAPGIMLTYERWGRNAG